MSQIVISSFENVETGDMQSQGESINVLVPKHPLALISQAVQRSWLQSLPPPEQKPLKPASSPGC